jgi:hypothetical protein
MKGWLFQPARLCDDAARPQANSDGAAGQIDDR